MRTNFRKPWHLFGVMSLLMALLIISPRCVSAQTDSELTISMLRNFGSALGGNISGTFTIRAKGPDKLDHVTFYLDNEPIGTVDSPPYNLKFNTSAYAEGTHTITAVGTTTDDQELQSNSITRNFLTQSESNKSIILFVVPLVLLIIVARFAAHWISKRGDSSSPEVAALDGPNGGTICPKCHKPFARHWWGLNFGTSKYDRCPHCHKWSLVKRVPPELLQASIDTMQQSETPSEETTTTDNKTDRKRRLDDSRFEP